MKNVTRATARKMEQLLTESWNFAWLIVGYLFMQLFIWYPTKEGSYLYKLSGILFERCSFLLHL